MDSDSDTKLKSLISQLQYHDDTDSNAFLLIIKIISLVKSTNLDLQPKSELMSLASRTIDLFSIMDLDSQLKSHSQIISLISTKFTLLNPMDSDSDSEWKLRSLVPQLKYSFNTDPKVLLPTVQIISLVRSSVLNLQPKSELMSLVSQVVTLVNSADSDSESKLKSLISQLEHTDNTDSKVLLLIVQIISLVTPTDIELQPKSELMSLVSQAVTHFLCMDLDSHPMPLSQLISLISTTFILLNSMASDPVLRLKLLISRLQSRKISGIKALILLFHIISLVKSMDLDSQPNSELMSFASQIVSLFNSVDLDSQPKPLLQFMSLSTQTYSIINYTDSDSEREPSLELQSLLEQVFRLEQEPELILVIGQIFSLAKDMNLELKIEPELELLSLTSQLFTQSQIRNFVSDVDWLNFLTTLPIIKIISFVCSMDLESQPRPESKFMSLVTQAVSVFNSMNLESLPEPFSKLRSFFFKNLYLVNSTKSSVSQKLEWELKLLVKEILCLEPEPEVISLIRQIIPLIVVMISRIISLCPQAEVRLENGKFCANTEFSWMMTKDILDCQHSRWEYLDSTRYNFTHFLCKCCNGENHEEYEKAPVEIKHPLHPKHHLQLVAFEDKDTTRECSCCDKDLKRIFYCCLACNFAMNIACMEKQPVLSMDRPRWHDHTLALFPSQISLPCNLCALTHSASCPFYICAPCEFVAHQSCFNLPRVIRISRHRHRVAFTPLFVKGDWSCGVCRRKINNDYGGYSCIKGGVCSYAVHSKCATQKNVWDGIELEGEPEIEEEELEPFVRIRDGVIQHFSHQHHHMTLDKNIDRSYDENKQCQACSAPIYFGNFYFCMQCDYLLHEECANLSRKIHHPVHPHLLTLGTNYDVLKKRNPMSCSTCSRRCTGGFYYACHECSFELDVKCGTITEPLVHESHRHTLFLTSRPGEGKICYVCKKLGRSDTNETFNCIEEECDFALCFKCATIPHQVRYKHDKHIMTLSYGEGTSIMTYWCEVCEGEVNPKKRYYKCDEYCCLTIHVKCMIGKYIYMKPGSSWPFWRQCVDVLPNTQHMSRPICTSCAKYCLEKVVFLFFGLKFCSTTCMSDHLWK